MSRRYLLPAALAALTAASCGSPTAPPPPVPVYDVVAIVFYDENGNGLLDANERVRLGGVTLQIAGGQGHSDKNSGRTVVSGVPAGTHPVSIRTETLPPFYTPGATATITVPQQAGHDVNVPVTLPVDGNVPNTYMAFGDSITVGDGSTDGMGYRSILQADLVSDLNAAVVIDDGIEATRTDDAAARITGDLARIRPSFTLIHYGTNDWNDPLCKLVSTCFTVDNLRIVVRDIKAANGLPVLATIIPGNPSFPQVPQARQDWIHGEDALIRTMAAEEGAVLVDLEAAFLAHGDLPSLFSDHVHPNDQGYQIMAEEFHKALTQPTGKASACCFEPEPLPDLPLSFSHGPAGGVPQPGLLRFERPRRERTRVR